MEIKQEIVRPRHDPRGIAASPGDFGWQGDRRVPPRIRQTPMMTLRAWQRLVMILGGKMASDFRRIVRRNVFLKAFRKEKHITHGCA